MKKPINKMNLPELLQMARSLNSITKNLKLKDILKYTKSGLRTFIFDNMKFTNDSDESSKLMQMDILDNVYLINGEEFNVIYELDELDESYCIRKDKINYIVEDFTIFKVDTMYNKIRGTTINNSFDGMCDITPVVQKSIVIYKKFDYYELYTFYMKFIEVSKIESIFDRIKKIIT